MTSVLGPTQPTAVDFAAVVGAGLVQIHVHVLPNVGPLANNTAGVVATVGGVSTQATGNLIPF